LGDWGFVSVAVATCKSHKLWSHGFWMGDAEGEWGSEWRKC